MIYGWCMRWTLNSEHICAKSQQYCCRWTTWIAGFQEMFATRHRYAVKTFVVERELQNIESYDSYISFVISVIYVWCSVLVVQSSIRWQIVRFYFRISAGWNGCDFRCMYWSWWMNRCKDRRFSLFELLHEHLIVIFHRDWVLVFGSLWQRLLFLSEISWQNELEYGAIVSS